jgi:hypothetical protein
MYRYCTATPQKNLYYIPLRLYLYCMLHWLLITQGVESVRVPLPVCWREFPNPHHNVNYTAIIRYAVILNCGIRYNILTSLPVDGYFSYLYNTYSTGTG